LKSGSLDLLELTGPVQALFYLTSLEGGGLLGSNPGPAAE